MSFNRENVLWQSSDGTWGRGFYTVHENWWDEDADPEWDVEYDYGSFEWAVTGKHSKQAVIDAWQGANPGGWTEYPYDVEPTAIERAARFDRMAKELRERARGR